MRHDPIIVGFFAVCAFLVGCVFILISTNKDTQRLAAACEAKGGVYIRRLEMVYAGKTTYTSHIPLGCMRPDAFIDVGATP